MKKIIIIYIALTGFISCNSPVKESPEQIKEFDKYIDEQDKAISKLDESNLELSIRNMMQQDRMTQSQADTIISIFAQLKGDKKDVGQVSVLFQRLDRIKDKADCSKLIKNYKLTDQYETTLPHSRIKATEDSIVMYKMHKTK